MSTWWMYLILIGFAAMIAFLGDIGWGIALALLFLGCWLTPNNSKTSDE